MATVTSLDEARSNKRPIPKEMHVVIDDDGLPKFCCTDKQTCHDFINTQIEYEVPNAGIWVVRKYKLES